MRYTAIKLVTEFVNPEDIVMLGDLDELVDGGAVDHLTHEPDSAFPVTLYVPLYRSSFGCIDRNFNGEPKLWPGTVGKYQNVFITCGVMVESNLFLYESVEG